MQTAVLHETESACLLVTTLALASRRGEGPVQGHGEPGIEQERLTGEEVSSCDPDTSACGGTAPWRA